MTEQLHDLADALLPSPLLVVEDEKIMQIRLRSILLDLGYAADALIFADNLVQARKILLEQPFAMVLVDVGLPDGSGVDLIRELHIRDAMLPIVVISAWSSEQILLESLQAGATGYLLKERDDIEIALGVRSVLRGGAPIDPFLAKRILSMNNTTPAQGEGDAADRPRMTAREVEILSFVAKGLTNREIAEALALSRFTVDCHIKHVYKKLAVGNRTEAVFEARAHGLL